MFGLFYVFTNLIGITISGTKRAFDNIHYKQQGIKDYINGDDFGAHTYYDAEGKERDLTTDHIMYTYRHNGDLFIKDLSTSHIRNLSEEKRNEKIKEIKKNNPNTIAIFYKYWDYSNSELRYESDIIIGKVYKDVNNGELYLERYITWRNNDYSKPGIRGDYCSAYFYLKVSDGKIVSISDKQIKEDEKNNKNVDYSGFISFFNEEQDKGGFIIRNRNEFSKGKEHFYINNENICNS